MTVYAGARFMRSLTSLEDIPTVEPKIGEMED